MSQDSTRYALQLEMLERNCTLRDDEAIDLLRSEFALAQNAGRFDAITAADIEVGAVTRSTPQEGVTRYVVEAFVEERHPELADDAVVALICRALTNALNASFFLRVCEDGLTVRLVSRAPARTVSPLRYAA
jgi:hypothetical protein